MKEKRISEVYWLFDEKRPLDERQQQRSAAAGGREAFPSAVGGQEAGPPLGFHHDCWKRGGATLTMKLISK